MLRFCLRRYLMILFLPLLGSSVARGEQGNCIEQALVEFSSDVCGTTSDSLTIHETASIENIPCDRIRVGYLHTSTTHPRINSDDHWSSRTLTLRARAEALNGKDLGSFSVPPPSDILEDPFWRFAMQCATAYTAKSPSSGTWKYQPEGPAVFVYQGEVVTGIMELCRGRTAQHEFAMFSLYRAQLDGKGLLLRRSINGGGEVDAMWLLYIR